MQKLAETIFVIFGGGAGLFFLAAVLTDVRDLLAYRRERRRWRV